MPGGTVYLDASDAARQLEQLIYRVECSVSAAEERFGRMGEGLLRDWFAGQALAGLVAKGPNVSPADYAAEAYLYADAMLAERARRDGDTAEARTAELLRQCVYQVSRLSMGAKKRAVVLHKTGQHGEAEWAGKFANELDAILDQLPDGMLQPEREADQAPAEAAP